MPDYKSAVLPEIKDKTLSFPHFPTRMQAFIFRNWNMVKKEKIAEVLKTDVQNIVAEAERMGLKNQGDVSIWSQKGYISIIRANWHLIDYPQLCTLLDRSAEQLALTLKEEDFLDIKLGSFKPGVSPVTYKPLTADEIEKTKKIRYAVENYINPYKEEKKPFDFFSESDKEKPVVKEPFSGAVILTDGWSIINNTNEKTVDKMLMRFKNHMKKTWDISFSDSAGNSSIKAEFISGKEDEYHELLIKPNEIIIRGGSATGILRGLYRIESICSANSGPYLKEGVYKRNPRFKIRFIYPYCGLYHTSLDVDSRTYCPDELLEKYASAGINGLWLHSVLYQLSPFPYDKSISSGYEIRRKNLKDFIDRAAEYGIKLYLYLNEPRSMPLSFFEKYPDMKGAVNGNYACLCTSAPRTREYLKEAVYSLCKASPGLGGFFTITMSENDTHCKTRPTRDEYCPRCADKKAYELAADVNNIILNAAKSADENIKVIAWDWSWDKAYNFTEEDIADGIALMPEDIIIMCNRERDIEFERGGVKNHVRDYSISVSGISPQATANWSTAHKSGHETAVKTQINNTWECSTVPYLPVFDKIKEHMDSICAANVDNLMLSWSLGGHPSSSIRFISEYFFDENGEFKPDFDFAVKSLFGESSKEVLKASKHFSRAFENFPFDIETVYFAPQNCGVSNLLHPAPTGFEATMTCYPYDDLNKWRSLYPADVFENQFRLLCAEWKKGLESIKSLTGEFKDISYVSYTLFKSTYNQIRFVRLRDEYLLKNTKELSDAIRKIIEDELDMAKEVYKIMLRMPEIGFEAANHYYFSRTDIAEKIINCLYLLDYYK